MHRLHAALCSAFVSLPCLAHALEYYAGAALGANRASSDYASQVTGARNDPGGPPTDIFLEEDRRAVGRIFAGARLAPHWAVEVDYADLGRLRTHSIWHGVEPFFQFERFGKIDVRAMGISLAGSVPVAPAFDLLARAGAAYTWVDYSTVGTAFIRERPGDPATAFPSPTPPDFTANGVRGVLGLGAEYRIDRRWRVRAEWSRYFGVGKRYEPLREIARFDLDAATLGIAMSF